MVSIREYLLYEQGGEYSEPRSKSISPDEAVELIRNKCSKAHARWSRQDGVYIHRYTREGMGNCRLTDPTAGVRRVSANTWNYMTLIMDNVRSWKSYPRRSRSVIASASWVGRGRRVGDIDFHVFPYDGVKIGVCPETDIWLSFRKELGGSVDDFNDTLHRLFVATDINSNKAANSWRSLQDSLKKLAASGVNVTSSFTKYSSWSGDVKKFMIEMLDSKDIVKFLSRELSPDKNKFKLVTSGDKLPEHNNEVWIGGKCVLVRGEDVVERLLL